MQWVDINYLHLDFDYVLLQKSDENSIPHNRLYSPDQSHLKTDDAGATSVEGCSNLVDDSVPIAEKRPTIDVQSKHQPPLMSIQYGCYVLT